MILKNRNKALMVISDEHANLVDLLRALDEATQELVSVDEVASVLNKIVGETAKHFGHEEEIMLETGYPHYIDHQESHKYILGVMSREVSSRVDGSTSASLIELKNLIEKLMRTHMENFDDGLILLLVK